VRNAGSVVIGTDIQMVMRRFIQSVMMPPVVLMIMIMVLVVITIVLIIIMIIMLIFLYASVRTTIRLERDVLICESTN
jgi:hypothetical protein